MRWPWASTAGTGAMCPDLVFVKVATGIGAGVIAHGELLRGNHGRAGDIGHIRADRHRPTCCAPAATAAASARWRPARPSRASCARRAATRPRSADVVALVAAGDPVAVHHVREAGRVLGAALAAVVSIVAPSVIVVGGEIAQVPWPLLAGIRESVYRRASSLATRELRILTSALGPRAGVVGVSTLALEHVLAPGNVDALLALPARRG